ncbi:MAG: FAD:protein FMN transferase, partial [Coxiellaceae bacterium]|nr:FAD:protein FMN transferase [Coxiellaceae bacterium]
MGSPCQIRLYAESDVFGRRVIKKCIKALRHLNDKYTRYSETSLTSQINASAGSGKRIKVDEETIAVLNYANVCYEQSDGLFDITSGVLRRVWDFSKSVLPTQVEIDAVLPVIGWEKVIWEAPYISLPLEGMEIDFGGIVKEYAADTVIGLCKKMGIQHGIVDLGGDVRVIGPTPDGESWLMNIPHPRHPDEMLTKVPIYQGGVSTSGDYERFMMVDGQRYCHILNPKTGWPARNNFASVTVVADHCVIAGSATTVAMLKEGDAIEWLEALGLPYWCADERGQLTHGGGVHANCCC